MADQAAIRLAFARVHESLDALERELLDEKPQVASPAIEKLCDDPLCELAAYVHSHTGVAP